MPMVSVIMPVFNAGDGSELEQAIQSILQQTFTDFELIICDDASTDNTWEHLKRLASLDGRITLLQNVVNQRAGAARNRCIDKSQGRFIAFMDADDISAPNRLQTQLEFLKNHPEIAFVGARGEFFHKVPGDLKQYYWFVDQPQAKDFLMTLPFVHASIMVRREVIRKIGGYSTEQAVIRSEDYDMLMRAYALGYTGANMADVMYFIRLDEGTYQRRKYCYRLNECIVKFRGFSKLGLMPKGILYAIKPLIVGLIPIKLLNNLKKRYYKT